MHCIRGSEDTNEALPNLQALEVSLTDDQRARLDEVSATEPGFPHDFLKRPMVRSAIFGDVEVAAR